MIRNFLILFILLILNIAWSKAQDSNLIEKAKQIISARNEVIVRFPKNGISIQNLSKIISIDRVEKDSIQAYVFKNELDRFLDLRFNFRIVEEVQFRSLNASGSIWEWNKYPTYSQYISMMDSFKKAYPSLCRIVNAGKSTKGRLILFARITGDSTQDRPSVMYSSTIHGDELGGYVLMLRLINYLLKNYSNPYVKELVDNLDIWINPLANPDGAYYAGDNSVWGGTRGNANGIDLNRNFKDPVLGANPDGNEYQEETNVMMKIMSEDTFVLSANFHGGSEVVNYPWDCKSEMHPDSAFFEQISKEYADTVQKYGRTGYFTNVSKTGYIDGYAWYPVYGGRQDYITYFAKGHEVTIEIDNTKRTPETQLPNLWNYNFRSMLNFLVNALVSSKGEEHWNWPISSNIKEIDISDILDIYPNPCKQSFFIKSIYQLNDVQITISSISGKNLIQKKYSYLSQAIDVSKLKSGIYLLELKTQNQQFWGKLIINR